MLGRRPTMTSLHGMVAAAHPLAAEAGARILAQGGNAFDASVAVAATLNVVEPFMSGLAGLGYATMWVAAERRVRVLDFVTPVPASFPAERFSSRKELWRGPFSVAIPGNLLGWCTLSATYGRMALADLFAPAVRLAEDGFALAEYGTYEVNHQVELLASETAIGRGWAEAYPFGRGAILGEIVRQKDLAETLRDLGAHGPDHLYKGALGARIVAHLAALGGTLNAEDLAGAEAVWRVPAQAAYRGLTIHVPPPPSEAFQFLLTLRLLEAVDLGALARDGAEHLDLVIRAVRLAAGVRIANNNPSPARLGELLGDAHVEALRRRLKDGKRITGPTEQWMAEASVGADPAHTTSFSIADHEGNLICVTQSLGSPFGSGVVVPGTGLCLNNFLYWTDVQPASPNRTKPGGALPMCMAPSLSTEHGVPVLALGTPGSYGILQTQAQALVQHLDFGLPLQDALDAPRMRVWDGNAVEIENRIDVATIAALKALGHDIKAFPTGWTMLVGGIQAVRRNPATGLLTGAADLRRDGYVIAV